MSLFITTKRYLFFLIFLVGHAYTHEIVVSKIQIEEHNQSNYKISWIRPKLSNFKDIKLSVNSECSSISNYKYQITNKNYISSWDVGCGTGELFFIEADGINTNVEIFVSTIDQEERLIGTISLNNNKIYVDQISPSNNFFMLGVSHMFGGLDHLVVVLLFTLMATTSIGLIKTITAFTLGHSLTLALAYLGVFSISQRPIEALIALTIIALSLKLINSSEPNKGSTYIAAFFGLIHGFGFYGVLDEIAVDENIIANLFFFNIGIEVAQFLFIGVLLILAWGAKALFQLNFYKRNDFVAYSTGGIGMYWLIDRLITII